MFANKIIGASIALVLLTSAMAFGQMSGSSMGGGTQRESAGTPRTMSQDMVQNMTGVMAQMSGMLQKLSHPMGHMTVTEHARLQDMAKLMRDMAVKMTDLSQHLEKGKIEPATAARMQDQMNAITKALEELGSKEP